MLSHPRAKAEHDFLQPLMMKDRGTLGLGFLLCDTNSLGVSIHLSPMGPGEEWWEHEACAICWALSESSVSDPGVSCPLSASTMYWIVSPPTHPARFICGSTNPPIWLYLEIEPIRRYSRVSEIVRIGIWSSRIGVFIRRDTRQPALFLRLSLFLCLSLSLRASLLFSLSLYFSFSAMLRRKAM